MGLELETNEIQKDRTEEKLTSLRLVENEQNDDLKSRRNCLGWNGRETKSMLSKTNSHVAHRVDVRYLKSSEFATMSCPRGVVIEVIG